jgi:hypothetical protein
MPPIHNGINYYTELIAGLREAFGETGTWGLERFGETIMPVLDPFRVPEWAILRGEQLAWGVSRETAVAAQTSMVQLHNDSTNRIVVIEPGTSFHGNAVTNLILSFTTTLLADDDGRCFIRDGRNLRPTVPGTRRRSETGAVPAGVSAGDAHHLGSQASGDREVIDFPIVLTPGFTVVARAGNTNENITANWVVRSRVAMPGELRRR